MNSKWLNEKVIFKNEVLQSMLSEYFESTNNDCNTSYCLTDKEKKYFIKLFTSKLLDCKKCCKNCQDKKLSYRNIFTILYDIYKSVDKNNSGAAECYTITAFFYKKFNNKSVFES
jgi:hypothetical protein